MKRLWKWQPWRSKKMQLIFGNDSIGIIMLAICKDDEQDNLGLASLFRA